ncbi:hypothetical protein SORDD14_00477 [Streptococcus oralis]|uniref:Toxin MazF n=1 Tax=Streptococcus oralis TaxID=1303 RepID=A0A139P5G5_STROR|nr:hypothetical protein [Streptococcus oralis]KXT83451.1 hypothetical protein SORDD14_00477 [Streptococcus oralis]
MGQIDEYSILIARVQYADGTGSKVRPAMVIEFNDEVIKTYRLTSQYDSKSDKIKEKYFEIIDWFRAGLKRPSWIDTVQSYELDREKTKIKIIGKLTNRDIYRLKEFLSNAE